MCTVSIFLVEGKLLLTANRDESRTRAEDGLKLIHEKDYNCVYPVDSKSKGTWVGVNDSGVVAAILNMYQAHYQGSQSRGLIIPALLKQSSLTQTCDYLQSIEVNLYCPFVLLLMDHTTVYRYRWDGVAMSKEKLSLAEQYMHGLLESSSSVDPDKIIPYRQQLFQNWLQNTRHDHNLSAKILEFHLTQDPSKPSSSVCMARENGHTKSICQIVLNETDAALHYLAPEKLESLVNTTLDQTELSTLETIKFKLQVIKNTKSRSNNICSA